MGSAPCCSSPACDCELSGWWPLWFLLLPVRPLHRDHWSVGTNKLGMQTADAQMGFCPESFRVCSLSSVETGETMVLFAGMVWVMRHQNEMITSDNLANDLHWGGEHIKLNELHGCTQFSVLSPHLSFFVLVLFHWLRFIQNLRCSPPRNICKIPCHSLSTHRMWGRDTHSHWNSPPDISSQVNTNPPLFFFLSLCNTHAHTNRHKHVVIRPTLSQPKVRTD